MDLVDPVHPVEPEPVEREPVEREPVEREPLEREPLEPEPLPALPTPATRGARFQVYVSSTRCFWRLLGRNNRAYARSPGVSVTVEETRDSALLAARAAFDGTFELTSVNGREWAWVLTLDGVAVARSDGTYGRRVECLASIERYKLAAPTASLGYVRLIPREVGRPDGPGGGLVRSRPRMSGPRG